MRKVYTIGTNITNSLGFTTQENFDALKENKSGIKMHNTGAIYGELPLSLIDKLAFKRQAETQIKSFESFTFFEQIMLWSAQDAISKSDIDVSSKDCIFIISTTKGNVEELKTQAGRETTTYKLWHSANRIANFFNNPNEAITVSNACVSGVVAINTAQRLLQDGVYNHAVVIGADVVSDFVISGFMSFQALSMKACKPFDAHRDGLSLGEAAGCIVLSSMQKSNIYIAAGAGTNDANHISGPSRTGEGLFLAIANAMAEAKVSVADIDFISAHGTATLYNDSMETIALNRQNLNSVHANSFKAYWGHTLGASGVIETIAAIESMKHNIIIKSLGYEESGEETPLLIADKNINKELNTVLKTAAGFGGANASLIIKKQ